MRISKSVDSLGVGESTLVSISLSRSVEFVNNVRNAWTGTIGFCRLKYRRKIVPKSN